MKIYIKKLNICPMRKVNIFKYKEALKLAGHTIVDSPREADKVLVWTCAVREDFHENSFDVLRKFEMEGYEVVAAGCLPSIDPERLEKRFGGEVIHFNNDIKEFREVFGISLENTPYPVAEAPITMPLDQYRKQHPDLKIAHDDQFVKLFISEGCTRNCSYCTEIQAFPPYKSYPFEKILIKAQEIIARTGVKKIALFGDDIGAYGKDVGSSLIELIKALVSLDRDVQISLKQINPASWLEHFDPLEKLISEKKIFQILAPIQSANNRILALMERGYTSNDLEVLFSSVSASTIEFETHVIAGFPTETVEEWEDTVRFASKYFFKYIMGNIYMAGPGTRAARMDGQISEEEKKRRILTGANVLEKLGTVVGHNLSWRSREHITHEKIDFTEL